jgi:phenylacetate-coenzyme A ligase PaaK-like adenylate-forming protein
MGDFAVEHLSFSGRLASEMIHNFDVLSRLPLTKKAYLQCEIMKSALRHTSRVTTPVM